METSSNRIPTASSGSRKDPRSSAQSRFQFGPPPQLKSQYPADSTEKHVDYILVASFDIDRGPIMEYQYPGPISGDENMLAELMLPDQAHVRNQDWTIFFLHKDLGEQEGKQVIAETKREERRRRLESNEGSTETDGEDTPDSSDEEDIEKEQDIDGGDGSPLIYVQNLVNTKQDASAKRGAVVKAMAICTRHSFLHIYKPLLLLALEEYFKSPFPETLAALYDAVNSMDLSLMPQLSTLERHILQASDLKDLYTEKFEQMIQQRLADESRSNSLSSPESPTKMTAVQHGPKYTIPRDTHEFETKVMYHQIPIPIKVPTAISPETVGDFSIIKLIQAFSTPHTTSPQPFTIHPHLTTSGAYTHPIIVLVNAMLTQKRVIFLGHNRPSGEVAEAVLAACALASGGILRGFTRHAFPYTDLTKIDDLLQVPGFIAGVTNPAFANHPEWWDLLCDVPTGRMKISSRIEPAPTTQGLIYFQQQNPTYAPNSTGAISNTPSLSNPDPTGDAAFIDDILRSITARHGESAIRCKWRDYITKFTRIAAAFEESVYGASALYPGTMEMDAGAHGVRGHGYVWPDEQSRLRELGANVCRIEGWRNTRSYFSFIQSLVVLFERRPIRSLDLAHQHDCLRSLKLSHDDSGAIYLALFARIRTYDEVCQLLTVTPESNAGLFYISLGLFHPDLRVRNATADLLERIVDHAAGKHFWAQLGRFAKLAYVRTRSRNGGFESPLDSSTGMGHFGSIGGLDARVHAEVGRAS